MVLNFGAFHTLFFIGGINLKNWRGFLTWPGGWALKPRKPGFNWAFPTLKPQELGVKEGLGKLEKGFRVPFIQELGPRARFGPFKTLG